MLGIENLHGWDLIWFCVVVGISLAGLLVALGVFVDVAARLGERWGAGK